MRVSPSQFVKEHGASRESILGFDDVFSTYAAGVDAVRARSAKAVAFLDDKAPVLAKALKLAKTDASATDAVEELLETVGLGIEAMELKALEKRVADEQAAKKKK